VGWDIKDPLVPRGSVFMLAGSCNGGMIQSISPGGAGRC
jgi:hypothetical protein